MSKEDSPLFKAHVAMTAIRGEGSLTELSKRFDVPAELIEEWVKTVIAANTKKDDWL